MLIFFISYNPFTNISNAILKLCSLNWLLEYDVGHVVNSD